MVSFYSWEMSVCSYRGKVHGQHIFKVALLSVWCFSWASSAQICTADTFWRKCSLSYIFCYHNEKMLLISVSAKIQKKMLLQTVKCLSEASMRLQQVVIIKTSVYRPKLHVGTFVLFFCFFLTNLMCRSKPTMSSSEILCVNPKPDIYFYPSVLVDLCCLIMSVNNSHAQYL